MGVSGISTGFPVLSQSSGQVAHVLLTRSPLGLLRCKHQMDLVRLACVRHAASVRPEPGSNSPSRLPTRSEDLGEKSESRLWSDSSKSTATNKPEGLPAAYCLHYLLTVNIPAFPLRCRPHWLLALALPFSRSNHAQDPNGQRCMSRSSSQVTHSPASTRPQRGPVWADS